MKNTIKDKLDQLKQKMGKDPSLKNEYEKDPVLFLEKNGIDTDDLPPEILEKISGGFISLFTDLLFGSSGGGDTTVNNYNNYGSDNSIISDSNVRR